MARHCSLLMPCGWVTQALAQSVATSSALGAGAAEVGVCGGAARESQLHLDLDSIREGKIVAAARRLARRTVAPLNRGDGEASRDEQPRPIVRPIGRR